MSARPLAKSSGLQPAAAWAPSADPAADAHHAARGAAKRTAQGAATGTAPGGRGRPAPLTPVAGDTPGLRVIALLEHIAESDQLHSLQSLAEATGTPKPTLHRMLQQLESAGFLQREDVGRRYASGVRFRRLAHTLLLNNSLHGARHLVLRQLVEELGESCNITALSGGEVIYLDRVETAAPLRFYLQPGSRVPAHCSASGKLFLSQMPGAQRLRLLQATPLQAFTPHTLTQLPDLQTELASIQHNGYALDREEFLPGLLCVAVPVPAALGAGGAAPGRATMCVAVQAPVMRLPAERALQVLPALRRAASALAALEAAAPAKAASKAAPKALAKGAAKDTAKASAHAAARGAHKATNRAAAEAGPEPAAKAAVAAQRLDA